MWKLVLSLSMVLVVGAANTAYAQQYVNGYTYIAPSYHLTPPVLAPPPAVVLGPGPIMLARPVYAPVIPMQPGYVSPTVLPYAPVYPTGYYRERFRTTPRETEYRSQIDTPYGRSVYSYEIENRRGGAVVRERYR